jgi:hypothetical protein
MVEGIRNRLCTAFFDGIELERRFRRKTRPYIVCEYVLELRLDSGRTRFSNGSSRREDIFYVI